MEAATCNIDTVVLHQIVACAKVVIDVNQSLCTTLLFIRHFLRPWLCERRVIRAYLTPKARKFLGLRALSDRLCPYERLLCHFWPILDIWTSVLLFQFTLFYYFNSFQTFQGLVTVSFTSRLQHLYQLSSQLYELLDLPVLIYIISLIASVKNYEIQFR